MAAKGTPKTEDAMPAAFTNWAMSAEQATRATTHPEPGGRGARPAPPTTGRSASTAVQREETGISWDPTAVDWSLLERSTVDRVRARFRSSLPEYIWDAAALEGNPYTLPEVQTLLEGITVTGHRIADQNQILALNEGFTLVDDLVGRGGFRLAKDASDALHSKVAVHEAIEAGHFRGEGAVGGGGLVSLGALGTYRASEPGEGGTTLRNEFSALSAHLRDDVEDPREQAIVYFCAATRRQFYFDGNKRTAKLMMAGHLMSHGYDAISISATRRLEFNALLAQMFDDGDATAMMQFIVDCRPE